MFIKWIAAVVLATLFAGAYFMPREEGETPIANAPAATIAPDPENPVELGDVRWSRSLSDGLARAAAENKPVLILFQEVPGCSNCTRYGNTALRHPLIVEAIETLFVPVCIYNNKGGADAEVLRRYSEPSWNNPVVRIVRADGADIVPRNSNFGALAPLITQMRLALEKTGAGVPQYLKLLEEETVAREQGTASATFFMHCFWSGEGVLGMIPGVIATEPGFQNGREVVRVTYNPAVVAQNTLENAVQPKGIQRCATTDAFRTDREPKYYLAQTPYRFVPMTPLQAARANSLVGQRESPDPVLSPRQQALAEYITRHPEKNWPAAIGASDFTAAWSATQAIAK